MNNESIKDAGKDDAGLQALLRLRAEPVMPEGLEARIVAIAARTAQKKNKIWGRTVIHAWLFELSQMFMIPKPAYAFSAVLIIGLVIGASLGVSPVDNAIPDWTELFSSKEVWL
jgi:hypothetical protein